jgi:hypothetical protein
MRLLRAFAVVAVGAFVGTGCGAVVFGGDSMTRFATPAIQTAMNRCAPNRDAELQHPRPCVLDIQALNGRRIDEMVGTATSPGPFARHLRSGGVMGVVVNLGTNDAIQVKEHPNWQTGWKRLVALLAPQRCVVFTTVSTWVDQAFDGTVARDINARIRALHASNPSKYKIVDWNALIMNGDSVDRAAVQKYMVRRMPDGTWRADGLHENATGARWIADHDRAQLASCGAPTSQ